MVKVTYVFHFILDTDSSSIGRNSKKRLLIKNTLDFLEKSPENFQFLLTSYVSVVLRGFK